MLPWKNRKESSDQAAEEQAPAVTADEETETVSTDPAVEKPASMFPVTPVAPVVEPSLPEEAPASEDTKVTLVAGDQPAIWDIQAEPTYLFPVTDAAEVYRNIELHGQEHYATVEYYAVDLSHTLQSDDPARVAFTLNEAWDLSLALVQEITHRVENPEGNKHFIVVLNDGNDLFNLTEVEDTELYQKFLGNMRAIDAHASANNIHLLMLPGNVHRG